MDENSYSSVTRRADTINKNNKYRTLLEKWIQLEPNDRPKFQEQLKNLHSAELQTQPRPVSANKKKAIETTKVKLPTNKQTNPTAKTQTTPPKRKSPAKLNSYRSLIRAYSSKLDNTNIELNCDKHEPSSQSKIDHAPSSSGENWRCRPSQIQPQTKKNFNQEKMETEKSNSTRNRKKNNPNSNNNSNKTRNPTLIQWNCRGIRTNYEEHQHLFYQPQPQSSLPPRNIPERIEYN